MKGGRREEGEGGGRESVIKMAIKILTEIASAEKITEVDLLRTVTLCIPILLHLTLN